MKRGSRKKKKKQTVQFQVLFYSSPSHKYKHITEMSLTNKNYICNSLKLSYGLPGIQTLEQQKSHNHVMHTKQSHSHDNIFERRVINNFYNSKYLLKLEYSVETQ